MVVARRGFDHRSLRCEDFREVRVLLDIGLECVREDCREFLDQVFGKRGGFIRRWLAAWGRTASCLERVQRVVAMSGHGCPFSMS